MGFDLPQVCVREFTLAEQQSLREIYLANIIELASHLNDLHLILTNQGHVRGPAYIH
jgi:hypothetical protein